MTSRAGARESSREHVGRRPSIVRENEQRLGALDTRKGRPEEHGDGGLEARRLRL